ncbi:hypothetical protein [Streptomyces sp. URMC 125]|uniref:hypothetical protein n=1 Tax=Streptomyces sp. URMC 125 TaxID=3423419 RepID=UPI003F1B3478
MSGTLEISRVFVQMDGDRVSLMRHTYESGWQDWFVFYDYADQCPQLVSFDGDKEQALTLFERSLTRAFLRDNVAAVAYLNLPE